MRIIVCVVGGLLGLHIDYNGLKIVFFAPLFISFAEKVDGWKKLICFLYF